MTDRFETEIRSSLSDSLPFHHDRSFASVFSYLKTVSKVNVTDFGRCETIGCGSNGNEKGLLMTKRIEATNTYLIIVTGFGINLSLDAAASIAKSWAKDAPRL